MAEDKVDVYSKIEKVSTRVMLFGGPNDTNSSENIQTDEIDANAYETFTLEEMKKLILSYRKKNKDFLIARINTPDPGDQTVLYNFYYSAAEVNRVLFKFSANKRSLHRMKVKNPLNNMYIVGQVFYYKISIENIDKAIVKYFFVNDEKNNKVKRVFSAVSCKSNTQRKDRIDLRSKDCLDIPNKKDKNNISEKTYKEIMDDIKQGKIRIPEKIPSDRQIKYCAKYFANDEDFLLEADIRKYFELNALEKEDDFLYEIDRTQTDFLALLDDNSEETDEDISNWRRIFSAHVTLAFTILVTCFFLTGGLITLILLPIAIMLFFSFIFSLVYVLCCRSATFNTLAVNDIDDYDNEI